MIIPKRKFPNCPLCGTPKQENGDTYFCWGCWDSMNHIKDVRSKIINHFYYGDDIDSETHLVVLIYAQLKNK